MGMRGTREIKNTESAMRTKKCNLTLASIMLNYRSSTGAR